MIYTVIFRNEGQEIMKNTYRLGEEIVLPATPTKASDDQYDYTFEKWSNDVTIAMGDERTIVVDAVFTAAPKTVGDPYNSGNNNNVMLTVIIPIVGGTLLVVITGIVVLVKVRKKRKLRAQNKNQSELVDSAEEETES